MMSTGVGSSVEEPQGDSRASTFFSLPKRLEAGAPPESRGLARDDVRLLVSKRDRVDHAHFRDLPNFLRPGDLIVINTSGTMKAAVPARREGGEEIELHFSTRRPDGRWVVEMRSFSENRTAPLFNGRRGEILHLPEGATVQLLIPFSPAGREGSRLWIAAVTLPVTFIDYLDRYGFPIRYGYVKEKWPIEYYQTVYATESGSAEMPSAGRPFTPELITRLVAGGIGLAPLLLHTGVASPESHEPPYEEYYRVPGVTAGRINHTHASGGRVIAVGTTVVRALESVTTDEGNVCEGEGWTDLVITSERKIRSVDGMLTGLHEPAASHLAMLEALAGERGVRNAYREALREEYLWHEFGDMHLILG